MRMLFPPSNIAKSCLNMAPDSDRKRKCPVVCLASTSSSSSSEEDSSDDDEVEVEEISGDESYSSKEEEGYDGCGSGSDEVETEEEDGEDEESLCDRVISLLREGNNLEELYLKQCKAYLRKYGLRLAGTKDVCIQRIKEHWRLKDGNGEEIYPRSLFIINCRGDVCEGDVVLFTQRVYAKFNKVTRHGKILGRRTVAGRVVKESYGSAKQQHTFTIEVLWSKGVKKLPPLSPLLVKGRNLYKLTTFRQRWNNEAERQKVLAEKHKRGTAARLEREKKKSKKIGSANGDAKCHKRSHHRRPSQMRKTAELEKKKHFDGHRRGTLKQNRTFNSHHQEAPASRLQNFNRYVSLNNSKTSQRHKKRRHVNVDMCPTLQPYGCTLQDPYQLRVEQHNRSLPYQFSGYNTGFTSNVLTLPLSRPHADTIFMPTSLSQGFNHSSGVQYAQISGHSFKERNMNHFPEFINTDGPLHQCPQGIDTYGLRLQGFQTFHC